MKILHTSDWHLGRRPVGGIGEYSKTRYEDYFNAAEYIIDEAIKHNVDLFIIAGDLFDRSSLLPDILFRTEKLLTKLKEKNIDVLLIEGNHDKIYTHDDSWINYMENRNLVIVPKVYKNNEDYIFEPYIKNDIYFYGVPYQGVVIDEVLIELAKKIDKNKKNIIVVHTGIGGNFIPGCTKSEILDLFKDKVLYIAGGHLHTYNFYPKDNPYFFVPGCPEYWDLNEKNNKGYIIFDTENHTYDFFESKKRKVSSYTFDSLSDYEKIEELNIEKGEIIKLNIDYNIIKELNIDIEKKLLEKGALKVILNISYLDSSENYEIEDIDKQSIEEKIIKKWENIYSTNSKKTIEYLEILKDKVYENSQDIFDSFDHFLDVIIEGDKNENK
ncbi:metallophosphoesterase family protein [Marinitoga litoralis]|uniref:metallophosphoesterase family protein n=1 Tax=Marinitoga litoralis TaxID=570855 RepID=UPI00195F4A86|nr:metallophosphoesterase [Marinitoga litoralis]MBM7559985.1 DNA repair exonuclease SbcCD nuclease subunit [Marinitoga litoralis]